VNIELYKEMSRAAERESLVKALNLYSPSQDRRLAPLVSRQRSQGGFFVPQVGDQVMYFFQGHEEFMAKENCHFFEG
jgi:hypothetical protein